MTDVDARVYLAGAKDGLTKIGFSTKPAVRMRNLGMSPRAVLHTIESDDARWLERRLHAMLADRRVRGEYFLLEPHQVAWLTTLRRVNRPIQRAPRMRSPITFSARLRALRSAAVLTQRALAGAAGLSANYVARLERGELAPSLDTAARLAGALGVAVDAFLTTRAT